MLYLFGDNSIAGVKAKGLCHEADLCSNLCLPFVSCVSLHKVFNFTKTQSPYLKIEIIEVCQSLASCED